MISQEEIYQHVIREEWNPVIKLLHKHRIDISIDSMLSHAANVFEQEFFEKIERHPIERADILPVLEDLFVLHSGKFYKLQDANFKKLLTALVIRLPLKDAYNYATAIPDDEHSKGVIDRYEKIQKDSLDENNKIKLPPNWVEIYNRLFELMNMQGPTYFSGPNFFRAIQEFHPYHPDYSQYIKIRTAQGKSTNRKIYFYDVLMDLDEEGRGKSISRLLDHLKPFEPEKVDKIETLLGWKSSVNNVVLPSPDARDNASPITEKKSMVNPVVFISYSWDDEQHKEWVLALADRLVYDGVAVILDRYALRAGGNLPHFVEQSINQAYRILVVFTPNYKLKADNRKGGVGYEYSIMNANLYDNQTTNEKIIPVLRKGNKFESIPQFMQQLIHIDLTNDENFEISYLDLLREIYDEPAIVRPQLGMKPKFKNRD